MTTDNIEASSLRDVLQFKSLPDEVRELMSSVFSAASNEKCKQYEEEASQKCFCEYHAPNGSDFGKSQNTWTITAQLLRLMLSILNLASDLARQRKIHECYWTGDEAAANDLELMFHGGGRGGFQWLECLVKGDGGWIEDVISDSADLSCPPCLLGRAFESESTIRLLVIAARLAGDELDFYLTSIKEYLLEDPWWGPGYWETIEPKAVLLEGQVRELLDQCFALRRSLEDYARGGKRPFNNGRRVLRNATVLGNSGQMITGSQLAELSVLLARALENSSGTRNALKPRTREEWEQYKLAVYTWFGLIFNELAHVDPALSEAIVQKYLCTSRLTRSLTV